MRSKKGIELSVNFIVMLILAIVLFGFGIYFASTLFAKSGSITEQAFDKFDAQIEGLACGTADKVCVPVSTRTQEGGQAVVMGVVVENVLGRTIDFRIWGVPSSIYVDKAGVEQSTAGMESKLLVSPAVDNQRTVSLNNRERRSLGVAIQPQGVPSGTYPFNIYVEYDDEFSVPEARSYTDGRPIKVYVVVP